MLRTVISIFGFWAWSRHWDSRHLFPVSVACVGMCPGVARAGPAGRWARAQECPSGERRLVRHSYSITLDRAIHPACHAPSKWMPHSSQAGRNFHFAAHLRPAYHFSAYFGASFTHGLDQAAGLGVVIFVVGAAS